LGLESSGTRHTVRVRKEFAKEHEFHWPFDADRFVARQLWQPVRITDACCGTGTGRGRMAIVLDHRTAAVCPPPLAARIGVAAAMAVRHIRGGAIVTCLMARRDEGAQRMRTL
jgi:hypothetical protein